MENSENKDYIGVIISGLLHTLILFLALHFTFLKRPPFVPTTIEVAFEEVPLIPATQPELVEQENQNEAKPTPVPSGTKSNSKPQPTATKEAAKPAPSGGNSSQGSTAQQDNSEVVAAKKKQFGDLFGKSKSNSGEGNSEGGKDEGALGSISKGNGIVGGGLSGRKVLEVPAVSENSQKTGRVVVKVCVDSNGRVTSAKYTQQGSTTLDPQLIKLAEKGAAKYLFSSAPIESQCGSITFDFKVR